MAVLLVGSTGMGKSTLGNFLLGIDERDRNKFEVATDNLPKTQQTEIIKRAITFQSYSADAEASASTPIGEDAATMRDSSEDAYTDKQLVKGVQSITVKPSVPTQSKDLTVIDTPGLNENPERDLEHMINLVENLRVKKTVKACIFVVKFNSKIDEQYRDTIKYYSRLRPSLFHHNCIIVMTDYPTDKRSVRQRERQGIKPEVIISNVKQEIMTSSGICYQPIVFAVDCIPFEDDHEEIHRSQEIRDAILSCIFSQNSINTSKMEIAKTRYLLEEDERYIKCYEGEIEGYNTRLKQADTAAKKVLNEIQKKRSEISAIERQFANLQKDLEEINTTDLVTATVWSVDDTWRWFKTQSKEFEITSQWEITKVKKWTNGRCQFKSVVQHDRIVSGVVQGKFMRGLYARITLLTRQDYKFAERIVDLKKQIEIKEREKCEKKSELDESIKDHTFQTESIELLQFFIDEKSKRIKELGGDVMSLEEAQYRLQKMRMSE